MDISLALSVAALVAGVVLYFVAKAPKPMEIGRLMFFAGLLASLLRFAGHAALHIGG